MLRCPRLRIEVRSLHKEPMCIVPQFCDKVVKSAIERIAYAQHFNAVCEDADLALIKSHGNSETKGVEPTSSILGTHKQHSLIAATTTNKLKTMFMHNFVHNCRKLRLRRREVPLRKRACHVT